MPSAPIDRVLASAIGKPTTATDDQASDDQATHDRATATNDRAKGEPNAATPDQANAVETLGQVYEQSLASTSRRRGGSHYTSPAVAARIANAALAPLFADDRTAPCSLALTVCDPSMGGGACLLAALRWLGARAMTQGLAPTLRAAMRQIARHLHGVDVDPMAAAIARISVWLEVGDPEAPLEAPLAANPGLRVADGLRCEWDVRFDVLLGNPPWISFVGRAAQPLPDAVRERYAKQFAAFTGYRNLQGLFLERAASLLRPDGRMAFLVPSSMSEQVGYAPTRRAVARYVDADRDMVDVGEDAFVGVVQPCMIFAGTRRPEQDTLAGEDAGAPATRHAIEAQDAASASTGTWSVVRSDLDGIGAALLSRLSALPLLPAELFGERGVQTSRVDTADLALEPDARRDWPLLSGTDVGAFRCGEPRQFAEQARFANRFRNGQWDAIAFMVRQTAMFPIAAHARGYAFRNSLLAGFAGGATGPWSANFLVAWLNASPIRWLHFHRFRDARQGMPQVKVGHLRSIPRPVGAAGMARMEAIAMAGKRLGSANVGIGRDEQEALDALVAGALDLSGEERQSVLRWAAETPTPVSRRDR